MKLWLISPIDPLKEPWSPWYDKAFGFVVRAETDLDARKMASKEEGDEGEDAWLDPSLSTCEELLPDGDPEIILRDFAAA